MIRSRGKDPEFIYVERSHIKLLPQDLINTFVLINTAEFQSISQAALYVESRLPQQLRNENLIQIVLLVKEIQLSTNPNLLDKLKQLAADGLNWYIAETCGLGPLPPHSIDLDLFRKQFIDKPFKRTLGMSKPDPRKRTKVGL